MPLNDTLPATALVYTGDRQVVRVSEVEINLINGGGVERKRVRRTVPKPSGGK